MNAASTPYGLVLQWLMMHPAAPSSACCTSAVKLGGGTSVGR